jgi:hypothetical protein
MGKCNFCGKSAGWFRKEHKECRTKYREGLREATDLVAETILGNQNFTALEQRLAAMEKSHFLDPLKQKLTKTMGFGQAVDRLLEDHLLSEDEEERLNSFIEAGGLTQNELDAEGKLQQVVKSSILRNLTEGKEPESRVRASGHLPFMFMKSETLMWVFPHVEFYEQRTRTEYRGGHQGVSVRVARGVYYRTGGFRGRPIKTEQMEYIDSGMMAVTTKHVYFASQRKNFRTRLDRIVTLDPYEDGIGMQKEGVSSKPQIFKNLDGWFTYNLIANLNQQ